MISKEKYHHYKVKILLKIKKMNKNISNNNQIPMKIQKITKAIKI